MRADCSCHGGLDAPAQGGEDRLGLGDDGQLHGLAAAQRLVVAGRDEQAELQLAVLDVLLQLRERVAGSDLHLDVAGLEEGHELVAQGAGVAC